MTKHQVAKLAEDEIRSNRSKGGIARAEALSPNERKQIARKAASVRWEGTLPVATHEGKLQPWKQLDIMCGATKWQANSHPSYILANTGEIAVTKGWYRHFQYSGRHSLFPAGRSLDLFC